MQALLRWYLIHRRDLPWRRTKDPYAIWVSEIMLQQTQVATVIPFYERWMARFPSVEDLASADEQEVLSLWQGLGYYRRCRMLQAGAQAVTKAGLPKSAAEWQKVPGVGAYTAGAIASIAFDQPAPLVDGNVERVFARLTGSELTGPALNAAAWKWAGQVLDRKRPGDWNQALMELGATVCTPANARCNACPLADQCVARRLDKVSQLPIRPAKADAKSLSQFCWIPVCGSLFGVRQVAKGDWWEGMWEFPRASDPSELEMLLPGTWPESVGAFTHAVTNHRIRLTVSLVRCETQMSGLRWCDREALSKLPMPSPQRKAFTLAIKAGLIDVE